MFHPRSVVSSLTILMGGCMAVMAAASGRPYAANPQQTPSASSPASPVSLRAVLDTYCVGCHNQELRTAGLTLDAMDAVGVGGRAEVWEKVIGKLRMGTMPPPGRPRPDQPITDALVSWLENELDQAAVARPNPGRTESFHRLNRTEYGNAIRDLLALEVDATSLLPVDQVTDGFDNIADVLSVSPALFDQYLSAARRLSRLAVGLPPPGPVIEAYRVPQRMAQDDQSSEEVPFGSRGGVVVHHYFPVDGEYVLKIRLRRESFDYIIGLGKPHQIDVRLDGTRLELFTVGGESRGKPAPGGFVGSVDGDPEWEHYWHHADDQLEVRFSARAGLRAVGVSFVSTLTDPEEVLQPVPAHSTINRGHGVEMPDGSPAVDTVTIDGPYKVSGPGNTPSRSKVFVCRPALGADEERCARDILSTLARRAYRRPVTAGDVDTLLGFYRAGRREGDFDAGVQFALERILVDPSFLLRVERDPPGVAPGSVYALSDLELASRLSFFLWSSIPDDELLDVAVQGALDDPVILERQVQRLLADPRSKALVDNFFGQWLQLRDLRNVTPTSTLFPGFDDNLREALMRETKLFLESQLRDDRSVQELLSADYSFLNERLARHYEIPNIHGNRFRRVTFSNPERRGGLLGQGSLLTVTSYPNRTSPVLRGKWVLDTLLGAPPPPPPPDVPSLPDRGAGGRPASGRERLEQHRENPICATCHSQMDPLGFALENFDAIGAWRTSDGGIPIDASGAMPGGASFQGVAGLRKTLLGYREQFVDTVIAKLLSYALGRPVQYYDFPAIRKVRRNAAQSQYRWSSIILGIVQSTPFRMRQSQAGESTPPAGSVEALR